MGLKTLALLCPAVAAFGCSYDVGSTIQSELVIDHVRYEIHEVRPSLWLDSRNNMNRYAVEMVATTSASEPLTLSLLLEFPHLPPMAETLPGRTISTLDVEVPDSRYSFDISAFHCGGNAVDCESELVGVQIWDGALVGRLTVEEDGSLSNVSLVLRDGIHPQMAKLRLDYIPRLDTCYRDGTTTKACRFLEQAQNAGR